MKKPVSQLFLCMIVCCVLCCTLIACGASGGGSWQAGNAGKQQYLTLSVDPNNAQKIYAGSAQGAIMISTDGGIHWREVSTGLASPNTIHALGFDKTGKQLYAATDRGLFVSSDSGSHWRTLTSPSLPADRYTALAFDMNVADVLYLGTAEHGVLVSKDAGISWHAVGVLPAGVSINGLSYDTDAHMLWVATSRGVYRLNTGEKTWSALNTGLPAGLSVNTVVPASITGGTRDLIYAGTQHGFYRSQDNGAHWSLSQDSLVGVSVNAVLRDYRTADSQQVYVGTSAGVLLSEDQGQTWQGVAAGIPRGSVINALAIGGTNAEQILAAANTIYLYPGYSGNNGSGSNFGPIIFFVAFFLFLYYISQRGRRRRIRSMRAQTEPKNNEGPSSSEPPKQD